MRKYQLPTLNSIAVFESAVRHGSFTGAAEELALTQGAVSYQIRQIEEKLGVNLFIRTGRGIRLSDVGTVFFNGVRPVLAEMSALMRRASSSVGQTIEIAAPPTFANFWLAPRLPNFAQQAPELVVNLISTYRPTDIGTLNVNATIYYGRREAGIGIVEEIFAAPSFAVCSPDYFKKYELQDLHNLATARLIHHTNRFDDWRHWLSIVGLPAELAYKGPHFDQMTIAKQATLASYGVVLLPKYMIHKELDDGELLIISNKFYENEDKYYICASEENFHKRSVREFIKFVTAGE
jgi:LysR family transcriptional regulator, glycine cleavage system transcriptional activator